MEPITGKSQHLLILGPARSGTTLLASLIGSHPDAAILNEDLRMASTRILAKKVVGNKLCLPHQIEVSKRIGLMDRLLYRIGITYKLKRLGLIQTYYSPSFGSIEDYLAIDRLKIIGIIRNPNDVIDSMSRRSHVPFNTDSAMKFFARAMHILCIVSRKEPSRIIIVEFEDLVQRPEATLTTACDFIGLPFQETMLEGYRHNPFYPGRDGIDAKKANRSCREGIDFDVETSNPSAWSEYVELQSIASRVR